MIVLVDDANLSSLDDSVDDITGLSPNKEKYPQSNLEELRHLPVKTQEQSQIVIKDLRGEVVDKSAPKVGFKEKGSKNRESIIGSLYVDRTKDWIVKTSAHVDKLLSATFPHLCVHPAKKLRQGLLAAIEGLLSKCCYTLKESKLMLLQMSANGHSRRVLLQFFHPQVRSRRSTTEEYDPEVSGRLSGTVRRHIPMDLSITIIGRKWITGMRNVHHGLDSSNQTGPLSIFG